LGATHGRGIPYDPEEKRRALGRLEENDGNFIKTSKETGITALTLRTWRNGNEKLEIVESEAEVKLRRYIWRNIFALSSPAFINQLKARALEKGNLKDVCMAISILRGEVRQLSKGSEKVESGKRGRPLTSEDLQKLIDEEERKLKKSGGDGR